MKKKCVDWVHFFIDIIIIMPNDEHGDSGQDNAFWIKPSNTFNIKLKIR